MAGIFDGITWIAVDPDAVPVFQMRTPCPVGDWRPATPEEVAFAPSDPDMPHPEPAKSGPQDWFNHPTTGSDVADSQAIVAAMEALDMVSAARRTDAFRLLAKRYEADLRRMVKEDRP